MYTSIQFKGYKLFSKESIMELDKISNLNVIIGKNNSGKSSLLDVVEMVYDCEKFEKYKKRVDSILIKFPMTKSFVDGIFSGFSGIGGWNASNYWTHTEGKSIGAILGGTKSSSQGNGYEVIRDNDIPLSNQSYFQRGMNVFSKEREKYVFRRLSAERNILPEKEMNINLSSTGEGASNLVRVFLNNSLYDENVIEKKLLSALNKIMYPEGEFESIRIQQVQQANSDYAYYSYTKGNQRCTDS